MVVVMVMVMVPGDARGSGRSCGTRWAEATVVMMVASYARGSGRSRGTRWAEAMVVMMVATRHWRTAVSVAKSSMCRGQHRDHGGGCHDAASCKRNRQFAGKRHLCLLLFVHVHREAGGSHSQQAADRKVAVPRATLLEWIGANVGAARERAG
jgi:hypothetical protein